LLQSGREAVGLSSQRKVEMMMFKVHADSKMCDVQHIGKSRWGPRSDTSSRRCITEVNKVVYTHTALRVA